jgi:hypothetical protein
MDTPPREVHVDTNEARAGSTPGVVRYVLLISLVLVIVAFAIIWMTGAATSNQHNNATEDSQRAVAEQQAKQQ